MVERISGGRKQSSLLGMQLVIFTHYKHDDNDASHMYFSRLTTVSDNIVMRRGEAIHQAQLAHKDLSSESFDSL